MIATICSLRVEGLWRTTYLVKSISGGISFHYKSGSTEKCPVWIIMMNSTWENLKLTYYVGKILGLFPLAGRHKLISLFYSLTLWILLGVVSVYISYMTLNYTNTISPRYKLLVNVSTNDVFPNLITPIFMPRDGR